MSVESSALLANPPFPLTAIDRQLLAMKDEDFHRIDWSDLQRIIANNALEELKRLPSDLRRYLLWSHETKLVYGSITSFVVRERLRWLPSHSVTADEPLSATSFSHHSPVPFNDRRDYAVLLNDWPYGFANDISHIVVWSRTPIAVDDNIGDVTIDSRDAIAGFVRHYFGDTSEILWFKNWVKLQSVRGVDHVHVLVKKATSRQLQEWTSNNSADY
ncbi:hypothetical protein AMS68_001601 [Peltaster fructicola]|uniref:N-acetylglucosamine-induced protein 1 n=1 Tax=Peltaster fructicola TaxID=286661 RepID=A0A6H0XMX7_9PEZI|nr:hypothetical protein AMS68_001601 [Peltaster fructicola]